MCGKMNIDHTWAELDFQHDVIKATGCSYVEVDKNSHKCLDLRKNL